MSAGPYEYDENDLRSMHENMTPAEVYRSIENFRLYGEMVEGMDRVDSDSSTVEQHSAVQEGIAAGAAAAAPALSPAGASMDLISVDSGSRQSEPEPVGEAEGMGSGANLHAPDVPDEGRVEVVWTPEMDYMLLLEVRYDGIHCTAFSLFLFANAIALHRLRVLGEPEQTCGR